MFSKPEIKGLLDQYVVVELYTDKIPPFVMRPATTVAENKQLQDERFGDERLPLYVILKPDGKDGKEVARYEEGKINKIDAFAEFLRTPLEQAKAGSLQPKNVAKAPLGDLKVGLEEARQSRRLVLLEFAAITDTNSAFNDVTVLTRRDVREITDRYVLVRLFIDRVPPDVPQPASSADANRELLQDHFGTSQEPFYVVLKPGGEFGTEVARYEEGKIRDVESFKSFLSKPLSAEAEVKLGKK